LIRSTTDRGVLAILDPRLRTKGLLANFSTEPAAVSRDFANRRSCEYLIYRLIMPGQFEVMIERNFSSAHQLRGYKGKCENLHGHNYKIEIYARGRELDNVGLLVDLWN
jgi:hypothetical protein